MHTAVSSNPTVLEFRKFLLASGSPVISPTKEFICYPTYVAHKHRGCLPTLKSCQLAGRNSASHILVLVLCGGPVVSVVRADFPLLVLCLQHCACIVLCSPKTQFLPSHKCDRCFGGELLGQESPAQLKARGLCESF